MTTEIVRVTDDTTRAEIAEALTNLAATASRLLHHPDNGPWLRCHARMDVLLEDWLNARE